MLAGGHQARRLLRDRALPGDAQLRRQSQAHAGRAVRARRRGVMRIRAFERADQAPVIALWEVCGLTRSWNDPHKDIARKLAVQAELFLVGILDEAVMASVMAGYEGHRGWMNYLAVAPRFRGRGLWPRAGGACRAAAARARLPEGQSSGTCVEPGGGRVLPPPWLCAGRIHQPGQAPDRRCLARSPRRSSTWRAGSSSSAGCTTSPAAWSPSRIADASCSSERSATPT